MTSFKWPPEGGGSGTLTSVGLADASSTPIYTVSGSPVTTSGTLTLTLNTETANKIFSGPTTGSAAQPTFRSLVAADIPSGNLTDAGTDGIVVTGGLGAVIGSGTSLAQHVADATHNGYLSSADWSTFNSKQAAGSYITALTGDVTASGPGSVAATLAATSNSTLITLSGLTTASSLATVGTITSGTWNATTLAITHGGTGQVTAAAAFNALSPITTTGDIIYSPSGATSQRLAIGSSGNVLTVSGGAPAWAPPATSGTVTSVAMTVPAFLSIAGSPVTSSGTLAVGLSGTALPIANGGTAVTSVTTAPTASSFAGWDANSNLSAKNFIEGFRTQATAAATTTLVVGDAFQQYFTGSTTQTVKLPTTSIVAGQSYLIVNLSSGNVTVQSSGSNTIQVMVANTQLLVTAVVATPTTAANWNACYQTTTITAPVNPTIQTFTSGTGTYTTPTGVQFIRVRAVGGGGGGAGSGSSGNTAGGTGGTTTFGTTLISCTGGVGADPASAAGGAGGTASLGSGPIGTPLTGGRGNGGDQALVNGPGGIGGTTIFGGAGGGGGNALAGTAAAANTGAGGGGAGGGASVGSQGGGGAGGAVDCLITSGLAATYSYAIGALGSAGGGGTGGSAGGAGALGYIEVTEYYANLAVGTTTSVTANNIFAGPTSGGAATPTFRALVGADLPAPVSFIARLSGGTPTTNSWTIMPTMSVVQDTNSGYNNGAATYTIPTAGVYSIFMNINTNVAGNTGARVVINGSIYSTTFAANTGIGASIASFNVQYLAAANDTIVFDYYVTASGAFDSTNGGSTIGLHLLI